MKYINFSCKMISSVDNLNKSKIITRQHVSASKLSPCCAVSLASCIDFLLDEISPFGSPPNIFFVHSYVKDYCRIFFISLTKGNLISWSDLLPVESLLSAAMKDADTSTWELSCSRCLCLIMHSLCWPWSEACFITVPTEVIVAWFLWVLSERMKWLRALSVVPYFRNIQGTGMTVIITRAQMVITHSNPILLMRGPVNKGKMHESEYRKKTSMANADVPSSAP